MKKVSLEMLTTDQLVARYAAMGVAQYDALELDELSKYNRLFQRMMAIVNELKSRPGDGRHAYWFSTITPTPRFALLRLTPPSRLLAQNPGPCLSN